MVVAFPNFRANWLKTFNWFVQEGKLNDDLFGKILIALIAGTFASIVAPVMTIYDSLKNQLGKLPQGFQQPAELTSQERYKDFINWFNSVFNADWNSEENFRAFVWGWNWFDNRLVIHFNHRPKKNELDELKERLNSYGLHSGWVFSNFNQLYLHNFGTESKWSAQALFVDKVAENQANRVDELARVEREKELDNLPISLMNQNKDRLRERAGASLPLWANRKGRLQLINLASHAVLVGSTGSGKSVALTYWFWSVDTLKKSEDEVYILDYKRGKDWAPFHGDTSGFYSSAEDTKQAWESLYNLFKAFQTGVEDIGDKIIYIFIDELSSLVESYNSKKERDEFLRKFKDMLRLSRSLGTGQGGFRIIVGLQQADSTYFGGTEGRGNLGIRVALGGITTEGARMLFEITNESEKPESSPAGKGFAQIYGQPIQRIMIPFVEDREQVLEDIAERYKG